MTRLDSRIRKLEASIGDSGRCSSCGQRALENTVRIFSNLAIVIDSKGGEPRTVCGMCGMPLADRQPGEPVNTLSDLRRVLNHIADRITSTQSRTKANRPV